MNSKEPHQHRRDSLTQTIGLIAEYNPFHNGHRYQLEKIRALHPNAAIAVVMSGSFTQRGEAAILDKWTRAETAVRNGVDLVCELPYTFACRSAEHFARGGVQSLAVLGIDVLAFGAETDDIEKLQMLARCMETEPFQAALHERIASGASYASALSDELMERTNVDASILHEPNNILAIEYLRALARYAPDATPLLLQRKAAGYHDTDIHGTIASASAIRQALILQPPSQKEGGRASGGGCPVTSKCLKRQEHLPSASLTAPSERGPKSELQSVMPKDTWIAIYEAFPGGLPQQELLLRPLHARLLTMTANDLQSITGLSEGLEHRLLDKSSSLSLSPNDNDAWERLTQSIATSRYPRSRIRRSLLHILTGFTQDAAASCDATGPCYLRVLAMNPQGAKLLHHAKKTARLPIITKTSQYLKSRDALRSFATLSEVQQMLLFDVRATELRNLALPVPKQAFQDFLTSPIYVKQ